MYLALYCVIILFIHRITCLDLTALLQSPHNRSKSDVIVDLKVTKNTTENCLIILSSKSGDILYNGYQTWTIKLKLLPNDKASILHRDLRSDWVDAKGLTISKDLQPCEFGSGVVNGIRNSKAFVTICNKHINGYLHIDSNAFFIYTNTTRLKDHNLSKRSRREIVDDRFGSSDWLFNLTGDTFDVSNKKKNINKVQEIGLNYSQQDLKRNYVSSDEMKEFIINEEDGYFLDNTWSTFHTKSSSNTNSLTPRKWLKIAVGVDATVVNFHGKNKVEQYVLALLNIVSAIFEDPSLNANTKLIISRLMFYEHKKHNTIRPGNAKKSLENVNKWNRKLHQSMKSNDLKHDVAIWITKSDIGGPSGYSPVGGACDPKRSCALARDEGLTSAFIIAHELGHILGLTHDGDARSNNPCTNETSMGSIMSPMVYATFNKFLWSECSKNEFERLTSNWKCLQTAPRSSNNYTALNMTLNNVFSMDEQCRMEFGDGYRMCKVFDIIEPCTHLWCEDEKSLMVCKTKKGPPLEGTECGFGKWCVNGYCEDIHQRQSGSVPVFLNPQNGGWGDWEPYGPCSMTCGYGVSFRTRKCDNPPPSYGGIPCNGSKEEWKICDLPPCENNVDLRARQCTLLPKAVSASKSFPKDEVWLPFERNQENKKCKLSCVGKNYKNLLLTNDNLLDGTPCSYENEDNICVQGKCINIGCDKIPNSNKTRDNCGICGGNNIDCNIFNRTSRRKPKAGISKIAVLPQGGRHIHIEVNLTTKTNIAFAIKSRLKKNFVVLVPSRNDSEIFEGTRFFYSYKHSVNIWAHGPILSELLLLVIITNTEIPKGDSIITFTQYSRHKNYLSSKQYVWIKGGWSPCSVACGGGRRKKTAACWDDHEKKIVKKKFCSLLEKPFLESDKCNAFSCDFQWILGDWEHCSHTCGHSGVQKREVYCVPTASAPEVTCNNGTVLKLSKLANSMVSPNNCRGKLPQLERSCNRNMCLLDWSFGNWSQCTTSCGTGIQVRTAICPHPPDENYYTCGEDAFLQQKRECNIQPCKRETKNCKNYSKYCSLKEIVKYCALKSFRKYCCTSCLTASNM